MPFILSSVDTSNTLEAFKRIVKNYQHVIKRNPTACCMIGFTAARMIRDVEGDMIDLEDMELWLQSLDSMTDYAGPEIMASDTIESSEWFNQIEKILCMVGNTTGTEQEQSTAIDNKPNDLLDHCINQSSSSFYTTSNYTSTSSL
ncbi:hypothetical protein BD560DRAFT_401519 [Blakeslea trispora]|nr:hypothetical protein BD560DRAFT_401519 [Blakeslea trispora]